nr:hypothetical protein [Tanacetum cinerariifolium]
FGNIASDSETESDPSDDPFGDHLAPLAISPFHDDPYMKVMQAYNATSNESPIPLTQAPIASLTVLPPSLVLPPSPLFDPEISFFPKRFCHLKNEPISYHPPLLIPLPHLRITMFSYHQVFLNRYIQDLHHRLGQLNHRQTIPLMSLSLQS